MAHARFVQHSKRQLSIPGLSPAQPAAQPAAAQPAATTAPAAQAAATPAPVANPKTDPQPVAAQPAASAVPASRGAAQPTTSAAVVVAPAATTSAAAPLVVVSSATVASVPATTSVPVATVTVPAARVTSTSIFVPSSSSSLAVVTGGSQAFSAGTLVPALSSRATSASSASSALATAASPNTLTSTGPSTGAVVGIVAGALIGVIILSTFVGFCFRRNFRKKQEDDHIFDKDDFRRESVMLDDDFPSGSNNEMAEYSLPGQGRNDSSTPRPPSMIANHFAQQAMPSFAPGQIFQHQHAPPSPMGGFNGSYNQPGLDMYGGYPTSPGQQHQLDRGIFQQQQQQREQQLREQQQRFQPSPPPQLYANPNANPLNRSVSNTSNGTLKPTFPPGAGRAPSPVPMTYDERRMSLVAEEPVSRSGTPTFANVQQSYFSHGRNESAPGGGESGFGAARGLVGGRGELSVAGEGRAQRTLSVRNVDGRGPEVAKEGGRPSSIVSDGYGGYA